MLIKSRYTHIFSNRQKYYIYNSQSGFFSEISKEFYFILTDRDWHKLPDDILFELKNRKILINPTEQNDYFYDAKVQFLNSAYSPDAFTIMIAPTTGCNFDCPYCFEPKKNPKSISKEVEDKIIEYINNQEDIDKLNLTWYGGEPLLILNEIERIYDRIINETSKTVNSHTMVSNGYLLNEKAIAFMERSKMDRIQITLDGIESNHNKTRSLRLTNEPTFKTITKNIENLAKRLPEIRISLRVNINKTNYHDFIDIYRLYNQDTWQKNIFVYPGIIREDTADKCSLCHNSYSSNELLDLYKIFSDEGINVDFMPRFSGKGCMIQKSRSFIIGPEGELYKCWNDVSDPDKIIGSIMDDDRRNYTTLMSYMNELNPFDDKCKDCKIFPICDGGCGNLRYRNIHEGASFDYCSPLKLDSNLEKALLLASERPAKEGRALKL
jgi:possible arylsulfatase regulator